MGAMARVTAFDTSLPGVGYVLKGGVAYESAKFATTADRVTISNSAQKVLASLIRRSRDASDFRHSGEHLGEPGAM